MVCLCLCLEGTEPQSFAGSLREPRCLFVSAGSWVSGTRSSWMLGLPLAPSAPGPYPHALPAAPSPSSDPRRAACPFKSGPADITAGGGGLARLPAPRRLQDPAPLCARLLLWGPRPGTPPPASSSCPDPRLRPRPGQSPSPYQGSPRIAPALSPSQGLSLLLSLSLSLSLAQGVWVSASLSPGPVSVSLSLCLSDLSTSRAPESLSPRAAGVLDLISASSFLPLSLLGHLCVSPSLQTCESQNFSASRSRWDSRSSALPLCLSVCPCPSRALCLCFYSPSLPASPILKAHLPLSLQPPPPSLPAPPLLRSSQ